MKRAEHAALRGEIIAIGNELTSGRITNTTSGFAAHHLFTAGYDIHAMHTIGDDPVLIGEALLRALGRVDFVVVTGGLGSTDDDLTTEAVARALDLPTIPNMELLNQIRQHLDSVAASPMDPLEKLAWLPQGAEALNLNSRMSGYQLTHDDKPVFFLPGIPYQMHTLLREQVLPRLASLHQERRLVTCQHIYKFFGMEEAEINRRVKGLNLPAEVMIGYYPVFPEVHLSVLVRTAPSTDPVALFTMACAALEAQFGTAIFGHDGNSMAEVTLQLLEKKGLQLATAESCTGGLIGQLLTRVPGSSRAYVGGVIAYANSMKSRHLGVEDELLATHGAVSKEVAEAMALGLLAQSPADIAIAVTGIAGPDGGSPEKPVGTVFIALATRNGARVFPCHFTGNRQQIQEITSKTALNLVRRFLLEPQHFPPAKQPLSD